MKESFEPSDGLTLAEQEHIASELEKLVKVDKEILPEEEQVTVKQAKSGERVLQVTYGRNMTRVLFLVEDPAVLIEGSMSRQHYVDLAEVFAEVHIIIIGKGRKQTEVIRAGDNIYLYKVQAKHFWSLRYRVHTVVNDNLIFGGVVRPDCVVATTPFAAGKLAVAVAKQLKRPCQIHINIDPFDETFIEKSAENRKLAKMAKGVLRKVKSVRTWTNKIEEEVIERFKNVTDISQLPKYYNFEGFKSSVPTFDVHQKYPMYKFIMLCEAEYKADSPLHDIISATLQMFRSPHIGLIVVGSGPAKKLFQNKVKLLNIAENIVFLDKNTTEDMLSLYKTADLLIETSVEMDSEEHIFRAIGSLLPVVAYETDLRMSLLAGDGAGFLVEKGDVFELGKRISAFVNDPSLRTKLKISEKNITKLRLHEDKGSYLLALRASIERVLQLES